MALKYTGLPSVGFIGGSLGVESITITSDNETIAITESGTSQNPIFNLEAADTGGKRLADGVSDSLPTLNSNTTAQFNVTWGVAFPNTIDTVIPAVISSNNIPMIATTISKNLTGAIIEVYNLSSKQALDVIVNAIASGT